MRFTIAFIFISLSIATASAQSTFGTRGLVKAPTARMFEDGTLSLGAAFIPPGYHKRTFLQLKGKIVPNAGLNTFVTVNLFPFMEVMFRYTHELNLPVSPITSYFPDRMFATRIRILKESDNRPAMVLGLNDLGGILDQQSSKAPNFTSTYLVASKRLDFSGLTFDVSLGYGLNKTIDLVNKEFVGLFGGVEITTRHLEDTQLLVDYDSTYINLGIQKQFFKRLHTIVSYYPNYNKAGWVLAYRYKMY